MNFICNFFNINWKYITTIAFSLFLSSTVELANAQIGRGCLVDGFLYTNKTSAGNRYFYRTSGVLSTSCEFIPTGINSGNCRLYNGGPIGSNSSYTLYPDAFSNDWEEVECPIDNHIYLFFLFVFGIYSNKFNFLNFKKKQIYS